MVNDRLSQQLVTAVTTNDLERVRQALADGASPNSCDRDGKMALALALDAGSQEIANILVVAGAKDDRAETSPAIAAAIPDDWSLKDFMSQGLEHADDRTKQFYSEFNELLDDFPTDDEPTMFGESNLDLALAAAIDDDESEPSPPTAENPLVIAVLNGDIEAVKALIDSGVELDAVDRSIEGTALSAAIANHRYDLAEMLLDAGASADRGDSCSIPLSIAAKHGNDLDPLIDAETRAAADRHSEPEPQTGIEPEPTEDVDRFIEAATSGKLSAVREAIANGIDVNAIDANHRTALMYAATYGQIDIVAALLDAGADLDRFSSGNGGLGEGTTALMQAAGSLFAGNREVVTKLLIDRGAQIDLQGANGRTALMCGLNYSPVVKVFIAAGANLDLRDREGNTVLMLATTAGDRETIDLLTAAGASPVGLRAIGLIQAVEAENLAKVTKYIAAGANYNHGNGRALICAAANGNLEIVRALIDAGADVNLGGKSGFTPLASAAYAGADRIIRILLAAGADVTIKTFDGESLDALGYAQLGQAEAHYSNGRYAEVIELLKQAGANDERS